MSIKDNTQKRICEGVYIYKQSGVLDCFLVNCNKINRGGQISQEMSHMIPLLILTYVIILKMTIEFNTVVFLLCFIWQYHLYNYKWTVFLVCLLIFNDKQVLNCKENVSHCQSN